MELKLNGKIKLISDLQSWDSGFTKREFVVTTNEQYPQDVKLEFIKDKTSLLDGLGEGDEVEVSFNVRGNEYNGKYYVNLQAWKIAKSSESSSTDQEKTQDSKKSSGGSKSQKEPKLEEEDLTENISELADAPF